MGNPPVPVLDRLTVGGVAEVWARNIDEVDGKFGQPGLKGVIERRADGVGGDVQAFTVLGKGDPDPLYFLAMAFATREPEEARWLMALLVEGMKLVERERRSVARTKLAFVVPPTVTATREEVEAPVAQSSSGEDGRRNVDETENDRGHAGDAGERERG